MESSIHLDGRSRHKFAPNLLPGAASAAWCICWMRGEPHFALDQHHGFRRFFLRVFFLHCREFPLHSLHDLTDEFAHAYQVQRLRQEMELARHGSGQVPQLSQLLAAIADPGNPVPRSMHILQ
jgi:hypothetical protein